ncbi:N-acetylmuramoyl-L-alanine amidase [Streptomyces microflavus]|uniref:N-acetylmuramoyl-L-alanine amidase n=1 Tax=Streptomyces microflavus TaxID=1919 RepID=UPI003436B88D
MATPLSAEKQLKALRDEGVKVAERSGWRTNNRNHKGPWGPVYGVVIHHTVSSGDDSSVALCYNGDSALPGPLCHGVGRNDGTVALVSSARANHAGLGDDDVLRAVINETPLPAPNEANTDGNRHFYGLEIVNLGDNRDTYTRAQYRAAVLWAAALCRAHGWSEKSVIGHKEWQPGKIDPRGPIEGGGSFSMTQFRADVRAQLATKPGAGPAPAAPAEPTAPTPAVKEESPVPAPKPITESVPASDRLPADEYTLIKLAEDTAALQGPCTYVVTAYATVTGTPGTRVTARFHDLPLATGRPSLDLPIDAGAIGPDGTLNLSVTRNGALDKGEQLRLELRADADATVTRRVLRALRTDA